MKTKALCSAILIALVAQAPNASASMLYIMNPYYSFAQISGTQPPPAKIDTNNLDKLKRLVQRLVTHYQKVVLPFSAQAPGYDPSVQKSIFGNVLANYSWAIIGEGSGAENGLIYSVIVFGEPSNEKSETAPERLEINVTKTATIDDLANNPNLTLPVLTIRCSSYSTEPYFAYIPAKIPEFNPTGKDIKFDHQLGIGLDNNSLATSALEKLIERLDALFSEYNLNRQPPQ